MKLYKNFLRFDNPVQCHAATILLHDCADKLHRAGVETYTTINTRWPKTWRNQQIEFKNEQHALVAYRALKAYRF